MYTTRRWGDEGQHYTIVQSFYVMSQIITTVGYGDYCPTQTDGMIWTVLYVLTAVLVLSSFASAMTETIIASEDGLIRGTLGKVGYVLSTDSIKAALDRMGTVPSFASASGDSGDERGPVTRRALLVIDSMQLHPGTVAFLRAFTIWFSFIVLGVVFFSFYPGEERGVVEAFYMSVITLTTVGFGDKTPRTEVGRAFAAIWMLLGVAAYANTVGKCAAIMLAQDHLRKLDEQTLLDISNDEFFKRCRPVGTSAEIASRVHRADFVIFMLKQMGLVDLDVVAQLSRNFDELDLDGNGYLDENDIQNFSLDMKRQLSQLARGNTQSLTGSLQRTRTLGA